MARSHGSVEEERSDSVSVYSSVSQCSRGSHDFDSASLHSGSAHSTGIPNNLQSQIKAQLDRAHTIGGGRPMNRPSISCDMYEPPSHSNRSSSSGMYGLPAQGSVKLAGLQISNSRQITSWDLTLIMPTTSFKLASCMLLLSVTLVSFHGFCFSCQIMVTQWDLRDHREWSVWTRQKVDTAAYHHQAITGLLFLPKTEPSLNPWLYHLCHSWTVSWRNGI